LGSSQVRLRVSLTWCETQQVEIIIIKTNIKKLNNIIICNYSIKFNINGSVTLILTTIAILILSKHFRNDSDSVNGNDYRYHYDKLPTISNLSVMVISLLGIRISVTISITLSKRFNFISNLN